jgi:hypothetical protein
MFARTAQHIGFLGAADATLAINAGAAARADRIIFVRIRNAAAERRAAAAATAAGA